MENHSRSGIECVNSQEIQVLNNGVKFNGENGVYFENINNSLVDFNRISHHTNGIFLKSSSFNRITRNEIFSNTKCGIKIQYYSNSNNITHNTITENKYCIQIGKSCLDTYTTENGNCNPKSFNDTPSDETDDDLALIGINIGAILGLILISSIAIIIIKEKKL